MSDPEDDLTDEILITKNKELRKLKDKLEYQIQVISRNRLNKQETIYNQLKGEIGDLTHERNTTYKDLEDRVNFIIKQESTKTRIKSKIHTIIEKICFRDLKINKLGSMTGLVEISIIDSMKEYLKLLHDSAPLENKTLDLAKDLSKIKKILPTDEVIVQQKILQMEKSMDSLKEGRRDVEFLKPRLSRLREEEKKLFKRKTELEEQRDFFFNKNRELVIGKSALYAELDNLIKLREQI